MSSNDRRKSEWKAFIGTAGGKMLIFMIVLGLIVCVAMFAFLYHLDARYF